ncbi:uracil-DNA glycosylase [Lujinxingia litoralis]|nr:uracil-DNA glycosylase [Lujinxingia litoralis]
MAFLKNYLGDCQRCRLSQSRSRIVFGEGDPSARLMFIGEAPGFHEDREGRPFVGKSGELLTGMIRGMKLSREQVYIANVVKCRPPENRNPSPTEIQECRPFLQKQIAVVQPEIIVTLGLFATQTLLGTEGRIGDLRGRWHDYQGIAVMPTYHPAFLMRDEAKKRPAWEDLKMVMRRLGLG